MWPHKHCCGIFTSNTNNTFILNSSHMWCMLDSILVLYSLMLNWILNVKWLFFLLFSANDTFSYPLHSKVSLSACQIECKKWISHNIILLNCMCVWPSTNNFHLHEQDGYFFLSFLEKKKHGLTSNKMDLIEKRILHMESQHWGNIWIGNNKHSQVKKESIYEVMVAHCPPAWQIKVLTNKQALWEWTQLGEFSNHQN